MPRKTLALISGLVLVTIILFVIALNNTRTPSLPSGSNIQISETPPNSAEVVAHSVLTLSPNPVVIAPGQRGAVGVNIDTSDNDVTAIQLEIAYDPNIISNVQVVPGSLFTNPVVLINKNDSKAGRYTYAYGIMPNQNAIKGTGNAATITFTALNKTGQRSQLTLLSSSLVTARGVTPSVLKSATGTLVEISMPYTSP